MCLLSLRPGVPLYEARAVERDARGSGGPALRRHRRPAGRRTDHGRGGAGMTKPADDADRELIRTSHEETLFVEAGAGTCKTTSLVARVVHMVATGHLAQIGDRSARGVLLPPCARRARPARWSCRCLPQPRRTGS